MEQIIGNTPIALVLLELALIPLFWWIGTKLTKVLTAMNKCADSLSLVNESLKKLNGSLSDVQEDLNEAVVRDTEINGRIKGITATLDRIEGKI